ncbi:SusC/RagA family TonB-linked outer membrane protein [Hufsiella ginkgonis]|uniref:SusC/RagA family TonB-linked outer membrane protein n=1 Tax=Hufsiella ginkgonis TaxID=2695274 RepID=A0A7K1XWK7_9SPHI|nr:TonB-dependent receptor [Hufsiella ginkgonis]MXV15392.1 SusC/RagA family TonB-linked outer membrane protein [Hufsiella ginkgonis]
MKKELLKWCLLFVCVISQAYAQNRTVTGVVTDKADGTSLPGVSVVVKGTKVGTQTSVDGRYSIVVATGQSLTFTYLGYTTQTLPATGASVNVALDPDARQLSEVVVTGYGVQRKREVGGAIAKISGEDFQNAPIASFDKAIQGRAAGVVVQANNGIPGGAVNVQIRGVGSFSAGTQPLYIVDGVQLNGATNSGFTQSNSLAAINSNDIESIEILKDAASGAIYGAQAANGVVLITTKKGKNGRTKFDLNYYTGRADVIKQYDVLNTQDYVKLRLEAVQNANPTATATAVRNSVLGEIGQATTLTDADIAALPSYNWQDEAFRTGVVSNYELSTSGGNDKTTFFLSSSYNTQDAIMTKADFKRGTFKLSLDHKVSSKFSVNANLNLSSFKQKAPFSISGSTIGNPAFSSSLILPFNPVYNQDGTFFGMPGSGQTFRGVLNQNIVATNEYNISNQRTNNLIGSFSGTYKFMPELSLKSFYSLDYRMLTGKNFRDPRTQDGYNRKGYGEVLADYNTNFMTTQTLNYSKVINTDHKLDALVGFEYRSDMNEGTYGFGDGYPTPQFTNLGAAGNALDVDEYSTGYKRVGYFSRVNYSFKGKYIINGILRYDGSSRFGSDNLFGWFPGVSLVWNISDEPFLKAPWINDIKLRASYGQAGNDRISNFASRSLFSSSGVYNGSPGIAQSSLGNVNLQWEKATTYDLGVDYSIVNNRISGSFGVFLKRSSNLLLGQPLLGTSGFTSITTNVGSMDNKGIEIELNTTNLEFKGFKWVTNFNFTYIKNEIKKLYGGLSQLPSDPSVRVGWDYGAIFLAEYAGVNPATGRPLFYDINGNYTYSPTAADRKYVGSTFPKYTGGLNNTFSYKGFDLDFLFQYQYGRKQTDDQERFISELSQRALNTTYDLYNRRWTTPGQITDVPRAYSGGIEPQGVSALSGNRFYKKTDYIRLKQIQIAYLLPKNLATKLKVNSARVYANGTNLFTYDDWGGYDPEFFNSPLGIIPQSKNFTFGLQVGF